MSVDLSQLNENQRAAVLWGDGPLLVLAGPGSGKTRVLTFRIARLLEERDNLSVLALTFTNKAAAEMRERVDALLGHRADRAQLCTFHSFAADVLRQHGSHIGIRPDFSLLTQDEDRLDILDDVLNDLALSGYVIASDRKSLLGLLDRLFAESYTGDPVAPSLVQTPPWVPELYKAYCAALVAANRLDFGSLLVLTTRLLMEKPAVARVLRLGWTHVCVDEFQDTNKGQYELLKLIVAQNAPNLFVVGDDDQIIYQWNGASPERLKALETDYNVQVIQLPENYRCPSKIVDLANKLIVNNQSRATGKKPLVAFRHADLGDDVIRYGAFDTLKDETQAVAQDIGRRGLKPDDCVILARTGKLLEAAADAIRAVGLEAYVARRKSDFQSPGIRVVLCAMRLANARHDRDILRRLCIAWESLTDVLLEVENIAAAAALVGGDFLRAWVDAATSRSLEYAQLLSKIRDNLLERLEAPGVVDWFLLEGWKSVGEEGDPELLDELNTWRELHGDIVREFGLDDLTLNVYLHQMDLAPKTTRPKPGAVRCLTVHGAKGLEFKHVYLIGMAQEVLPSFQALKKGAHSKELEEERRNCFVAITRAQESLTFTRARQYNGWSKAPSQFLLEMGFKTG